MKWNPAYTPGPWYYAHGAEYCFNKARAGVVYVMTDGAGDTITQEQAEELRDDEDSGEFTICELTTAQGGEDAACGVVMAMAPELVDSLGWIVSFCEEHPEWFGEGGPADGAEFEWLATARALLARVPQKPEAA